MFIETQPTLFQKLFAANVTGVITPKAPTATEPVVGDGVIRCAHCDKLVLALFGAGLDNATLSARVTGWRKVGTLWVPAPLAILSGVLGTQMGVAGQPITGTDRLADTITETAVNPYTKLLSPADNTLAQALLAAGLHLRRGPGRAGHRNQCQRHRRAGRRRRPLKHRRAV